MRPGRILGALAAARAHAQVEPYQTNDCQGFRNVLPSGQNGHVQRAPARPFLATAPGRPHTNDQLRMYARPRVRQPRASPPPRCREYYKDASFGVRPGDVERTYSPRARRHDRARQGLRRSPRLRHDPRRRDVRAGYAAAEDRLFFMDVLRNVGPRAARSFAGGAAGNRAIDADSGPRRPTRRPTSSASIDTFDELYGAEGAQVQRDIADYVAGVKPTSPRPAEPAEDARRVRGDQPARRARRTGTCAT